MDTTLQSRAIATLDTFRSLPSRIRGEKARFLAAGSLFAIALITVLGQAAFFAWSVVLLMELSQVEPRRYTAMYGIGSLVCAIVWMIADGLFTKKFKPDSEGHPTLKTTSVDTSRVFAAKVVLFTGVFLIVAESLIFDSRWPGAIAPGDGHVVQNGMDTKSALYTVWLMILAQIILLGSFTISSMPYAFDLYLNQYMFTAKKEE